MLSLLLALTAVLAQNPQERLVGDRVETHQGVVFEGRVLWSDDQRVVLRTEGRMRTLVRSQVRTLQTQVEAQEVLLKALPAIGAGRAGQWVDFSRYAQGRNLQGESETLAWAALCIDAECEPAHQRLGHRRSGGAWVRNRADGQEDRVQELIDGLPDPRRPWRCSSLHFELQSELSLRATLELYWQLERMQCAWRQGLGRELQLLETTQPLSVYVYRERKRFPIPRERAERVAWLGLGPSLYIDAEQGLPDQEWRALALRERIEQSFTRLEGASTLPLCWAEGLARLAARGPWPAEGMPSWPALELPSELAARVFKSRTRHKLSEVLRVTFQDLDFLSGFVLRSEESQALVAWALGLGGDQVRQRSVEYLGRIAKGEQGLIADFERAQAVDRDKLDAAWMQAVEAAAGL